MPDKTYWLESSPEMETHREVSPVALSLLLRFTFAAPLLHPLAPPASSIVCVNESV